MGGNGDLGVNSHRRTVPTAGGGKSSKRKRLKREPRHEASV